MEKRVRVRFAPSPTGGLHLGGVRTVLFNYLFAKQHQGDFILRIEDTDQSRYVQGAEQYIMDCLQWCGLVPDEGPQQGGAYGPYRQSERKENYRQYAEKLVAQGQAYYAFDTPEELEKARTITGNFQYGIRTRDRMRNSLTLPAAEVQELLAKNVPHVIRIKMPAKEEVKLHDLIRGEVSFQTDLVDDKVLLKADGMPTYHLAVVVDDYLMRITHVFRGEEWLPSAPVHVLLWKYLGWEAEMPAWVHLPLILKPEGNGKLSKRDGDRLGFPVYAMNWTDASGETSGGFREAGFLPEAFINMLALLGWNDGTDQELFSLDELVEKFSLDRVHKGGAKFNYEKAKWFNHEYIKHAAAERLLPWFRDLLTEKNIQAEDAYVLQVIDLIKERCTLLPDLWAQGGFFFSAPEHFEVEAVARKWNEDKRQFFLTLAEQWATLQDWNEEAIEVTFRALAEEKGIKAGELPLPLRIMLVGGKFGPSVFHIAALLGREETLARIRRALPAFP